MNNQLPPRKVCIMGTAPSSYQLAPFDDPEWEIWGTSRLWTAIPRWDVWFELHPLDRIGKGWDCNEDDRRVQRQKHIDWMAEQQFPIYLQHEDERIPAGIQYPLSEVLAFLSHAFEAPERYLTNSIAFMLALAIYEQVDEIAIYGVDMALNDEYRHQRPSCEYLIGLARGAGIKVTVPYESDLLKAIHLYGYEDDSPFSAKLRARRKELEARKRQSGEEKQQRLQQRAALAGRIGLVEEILQNGDAVPADMRTELEHHAKQWAEQAAQLERDAQQAAHNVSGFTGALDNLGYIEKCWL